MKTEAQKRASAKYTKKVKQFNMKFYPNSELDQKIYEYMKTQDKINIYLKGLVAEDMRNKGLLE